MEAAVAHSCAIFLAQNPWLDGFCSVVFYYEILCLKRKKEGEKKIRRVSLYKTCIRKRFKFSKVIVFGQLNKASDVVK